MKIALSRHALIFALALSVGLGAAFAMHRYLNARMADIEAQAQGSAGVKVLVAKEPLSKGAALTTQTVAVREMPGQWVHSNAIRPEQFEQVENQHLAAPAQAGEALLWAQLEPAVAPSFATRLGEGQRAVTVPVDEVNSVSGMIEPGDRIDLVAMVRNESQTLMLTLLQNAVVLATGSRSAAEGAADPGSRRSYTTITLETTPAQARQVLAAREIGKLAALLRAPGDTGRSHPGPDAPAHLLGLERPALAVAAPTVPVLYGNDPALRDSRRAMANGAHP